MISLGGYVELLDFVSIPAESGVTLIFALSWRRLNYSVSIPAESGVTLIEIPKRLSDVESLNPR